MMDVDVGRVDGQVALLRLPRSKGIPVQYHVVRGEIVATPTQIVGLRGDDDRVEHVTALTWAVLVSGQQYAVARDLDPRFNRLH